MNYIRPAAAPKYLAGEDRTLIVVDYIPQIKKEDIDKRSINRYFARKANDKKGEIIEIDEKKYRSLKNVALYLIIMIPWRISGPVDNFSVGGTIYLGALSANRMAIRNAEDKMENIGLKLTDPLQYYQTE